MMRLCLTGLFFLYPFATPSLPRLSAAALDQPALERPIVVTQLPAGGPVAQDTPRSSDLLRDAYGEGGRLAVVDPDGTKRRLVESFHSACDPNVAFDGKRLLLAGKKTAQDNWNVYEIGVDGSGLRQITQGIGDCRCPSYQSAFYQISDANEAWHQITFVCSRADELNETGTAPATALYSCRLDGSDVRRLTYNLSSDYDPYLMWDGRLVYASWQRRTLEHGLLGRVILLSANLDGTDPEPVCVERGRRIKHMACDTAGGLIVFVEADRVPWDGAGLLSCVSTRRPLHTYRPITEPADGLFHSPSPLPDGTILVSRRPADGSGTHGVVRFDPVSKQMQTVFDDPEFHDMQAKLVAPRAEPDGRSSPRSDDDPFGKLYCLSVYTNDFQDATWLPAGTVKTVRLLEGISRRADASAGASPRAVLSPLAPRRILGEVPIGADGSFNVAVPANVPVELQLIDAGGLALRSCGWVWTPNHFNQGCIGCHEDRELTPENFLVDALKQPTVVVAPPVEQRRSIDFRRDLMPIVGRKCLPCHAQGGSVPDLTAGQPAPADVTDAAFAGTVYQVLLESAAAGSDRDMRGKYVDPGRARTSPLVWHLAGKNTSRPWDGAASEGKPKRIPPDAQQPLTPEETRLIVEWIDIGAAWSATPKE
ncbi:MAG TPA: hypothetical protein PLF81_05085 [Candidatus Anammoximicrobium sp.]|nr:hypothetical protein [Candidatus Anammoximicrobium sp.]